MAKIAFPHVSPATRKPMRANKGKDTKPEMAVRRLVHGMGGDPLDHRFATHAGTRKGKAGALLTHQASRSHTYIGTQAHDRGCRDATDALGIPYNVAIVDAGAFSRQDGALIGSIDLAINKAYTARLFDTPTSALAVLAQPSAPLYGIQHSNRGATLFPIAPAAHD